MEEGHYDEAQRSFDSAFATRKRKALLHVSHLAERTSHTAGLCGKDRRSLCHEKNVLPYLPQINDLEKHISVYNDLGLLYRQHQMNDSTLYYYNKALEAGASGGKLLGAGGGGFILLYCDEQYQNAVREAVGLMELNFRIARYGSRVVYFA